MAGDAHVGDAHVAGRRGQGPRRVRSTSAFVLPPQVQNSEMQCRRTPVALPVYKVPTMPPGPPVECLLSSGREAHVERHHGVVERQPPLHKLVLCTVGRLGHELKVSRERLPGSPGLARMHACCCGTCVPPLIPHTHQDWQTRAKGS